MRAGSGGGRDGGMSKVPTVTCPGCKGRHPVHDDVAKDVPAAPAFLDLICPWCDAIVRVTRRASGAVVLAPRSAWVNEWKPAPDPSVILPAPHRPTHPCVLAERGVVHAVSDPDCTCARGKVSRE